MLMTTSLHFCVLLVLFCTLQFLSQPTVALVPVTMRHSSVRSQRLPTTRFMQEEEADSSYDGEDEPESENEAPQEDPEVSALKQEIADLESELKAKKTTLSYSLDQVEEYSKAGYARAVAEMENMRRVRSSMNSSNKSSAMAGIIRDFLPVYDKIESLKEKYANDEFGSKYGGLSVGPTFSKMGVRDFTISEGDPVDLGRMDVVASEHSENPKDTVLAVLSDGLELSGNIVRPAQCIASLGAEAEALESEENTSEE
mmetsp:Transcript_41060/g.118045  ORF Transcript_41060/g.118045 Transcript_41060/m.118045 type:complete len:256 (+) Transcript_41060:125-892(+)